MTIKNKIDTLIKFMPIAQFKCFQSGLMGSEQEYFKRITDEIINTINKAPMLYETDGKGDEIKPVLHYFWGNVDIYITEIDKSGTNQHFGYTSLGLGYFEAGYIDLKYIFQEIPAINLDLNFKPKTIKDYKSEFES